MINSNTNNKRGLLRLTSEYLYIANDGNPFDRNGVIAICMANLSSKGDKIHAGNSKEKDEDWIEVTNKSQLKFYKDNKNRLQTDLKEEKSTAKDYSGRWIFEILQNMDDAIGPKNTRRFIGTKGLGFLSVLEIAEEPAIFSNPFNFKFSRQKTQQALIDLGIDEEHSKLAPLFQVLWPCSPDNITDEILKDGYATVIRFKIKPENYEIVSKEITEIDHHFLLFSQHIQTIKIITDKFEQVINKEEIIIDKDEMRSKSMVKLYLEQTEKKGEIKEWIKWQRNWESDLETEKYSSCMFCLPHEDGQCLPFETVTKIYNFYPTEECSEIQGFLHVTFNLSRNRKYLENWSVQNDSTESDTIITENDRLIDETCKLIIEDVINDELVPAETTIRCFSALNNIENLNNDKNKPLFKIQMNLLKAIKNHSFIPIFGGGLSTLSDISIWKHHFIDCLENTREIQKLNLASELMQVCFKVMRMYGCVDVEFSYVLSILASQKIINNTISDRKSICKVISNYGIEELNIRPGFDDENNLLAIPFLCNSENKIVCLSDDYYACSDQVTSPSFIEIGHLSNSSHQNLADYFISEYCLHENLINRINSRLIETKSEFVSSKLSNVITNSDEVFWKQNGFEAIAYLYGYFIEDKEQFLMSSQAFLKHVHLPELMTLIWNSSKNGYFSKSWISKLYLSDWFEKNAISDEFMIIGINRLISEFKKFQNHITTKENDKSNNYSKDKLLDFLLEIGVRQTPSVKNVTDPSDFSDSYIEFLGQNKYQPLDVDYMFKNIENFLIQQSNKDAFKSATIMAIEAYSHQSIYYFNYSRKRSFPDEYKNFGIFQLQTIRWIKLKKSPIRPCGLFSPDECYISNKSDPVFPQVTKSDLELLSPNNASKIIDCITFNQSFSPKKYIWEEWIITIPIGYKKMLNDGEEITKLNSQVHFFYKKLLTDYNNHITFTDNMLIPVYSCNVKNQDYEFILPNKCVWNDTALDDDDLRDALKEHDFKLFILSEMEGIDTEILKSIGIIRVTDHMNFIPRPVPIDEDTQRDILEFIKDYWSLLAALDYEFGKSGTLRKFTELEDNLIICKELDISISSKDKKFLIEAKTFSLNDYEFLDRVDDKSMIIYVLYDDDLYNLIRYLCNKFFNWIGNFALVKELFFNVRDEQKINIILKDNNLNPNLVDYFTTLFVDIEETDHGIEILQHEVENNKIKQQNIIQNIENNNQNKTIKSSSQLQTTKSIYSNKVSKESSVNIGPVQKSKFLKKEITKKQSFSSMYSGFMRPRHSNEVIHRIYFDEDATPENQRIGKSAEDHIFDLLIKEHKENVVLLGKNNKGFDITFQQGNDTYYVEVKGLSGSWDDSDVLFSRAQFEKAQMEGEFYFIYVVEYVLDQAKISEYLIKNPASLFTKMQLDHGWRDFSEQ